MPEEFRLAVQVGAWCALRYGEVFEPRRKDLHTTGGVVHIRRAVVWTKGQVTNARPKTSAGVRDVTIPPHRCRWSPTTSSTTSRNGRTNAASGTR